MIFLFKKAGIFIISKKKKRKSILQIGDYFNKISPILVFLVWFFNYKTKQKCYVDDKRTLRALLTIFFLYTIKYIKAMTLKYSQIDSIIILVNH